MRCWCDVILQDNGHRQTRDIKTHLLNWMNWLVSYGPLFNCPNLFLCRLMISYLVQVVLFQRLILWANHKYHFRIYVFNCGLTLLKSFYLLYSRPLQEQMQICKPTRNNKKAYKDDYGTKLIFWWCTRSYLTIYPNQGLAAVQDADILSLALQIRTYQGSGRTVFLRWAPEFSGNWMWVPFSFLYRSFRQREPQLAGWVDIGSGLLIRQTLFWCVVHEQALWTSTYRVQSCLD